MKVLFVALAVFALAVLIIPQFTLTLDSVSGLPVASQFIQDIHGWFTDVYNVISTDYWVILIILGVIATSYYFLVQKPKTSR